MMTHHFGRAPARLGVAAASALALSGFATAGVAPMVDFDLTASDGTALALSLGGSDVGPDLFNYSGSLNDDDGDWSLTYDFLASQDPTDSMGAFLGTGFTVSNNTTGDLSFTLALTLDLVPNSMPETEYAGSIGVTLNGFDGMLSSDGSVYSAFINDGVVGTALDGPYSLSFSGAGTADDAGAILGGVGDTADTISVLLDFTLSPGDSLTTTGAFGVMAVPAPGAFALLGLAGLVGGRRRR